MRCSCCDFTHNAHDHDHEHDNEHKHKNNKTKLDNLKEKIIEGLVLAALGSFLVGTVIYQEIDNRNVQFKLNQYEQKLYQDTRMGNEQERLLATSKYDRFNYIIKKTGVKLEEKDSYILIGQDAKYKIEKYENHLCEGEYFFSKPNNENLKEKDELNRYLTEAGLGIQELTGRGNVQITSKP